MPVLLSLLGHAEVVDGRMVAMVAITWCQILCRGCQSVDRCVTLFLYVCVCMCVCISSSVTETTILLQITNSFHY